jgi:hypothetical protein
VLPAVFEDMKVVQEIVKRSGMKMQIVAQHKADKQEKENSDVERQ